MQLGRHSTASRMVSTYPPSGVSEMNALTLPARHSMLRGDSALDQTTFFRPYSRHRRACLMDVPAPLTAGLARHPSRPWARKRGRGSSPDSAERLLVDPRMHLPLGVRVVAPCCPAELRGRQSGRRASAPVENLLALTLFTTEPIEQPSDNAGVIVACFMAFVARLHRGGGGRQLSVD